jgi:hypothetical protein
MADIEIVVSDPANFLLRWSDCCEARQQRSAAVYTPLALWNALLPVIGDRIKATPVLRSAVVGALMTCGRIPKTATFLVVDTDLAAAQIFARTGGVQVRARHTSRRKFKSAPPSISWQCGFSRPQCAC